MNTRKQAQEKLKQAISHLEIAGKYMSEISDIYDDAHPEVSSPLFIMLDGIMKVIEFAELLRSKF